MDSEKKRMLIVDDAEINRVILRELFQRDYVIYEAEDGNAALKVLHHESGKFSVVILDLLMPNKDGFSVLNEMKETQMLASIPVVVVTQLDEPENEIRALDMGAADLIVKPFDPRVVSQRVKNIVSKKELDDMRAENRILQIRRWEEERYRIIVEQSGAIVFEWDPLSNFFYCSDDFYLFELSRISPRHFFGMQETIEYVHPHDKNLLREQFLCKFVEGGQRAEVQVRLKQNSGAFVWCKLSATYIEDGGSARRRLIVTINNVDKEVKSEQALRYRAEYDQLTNVYQRGAFYRATEKLLRGDAATSYVLVYFDIERFKVVNELYGTRGGDRVLKLVADTMRTLLQGRGTFGRLEADHFVACYPQSLLSIDVIINALDGAVGQCFPNYSVVFYFGLYRVHNRKMPVDIMCDRAKLALRSIKGNYMRRYAFYNDALRSTMMQEQEIVNDMAQALTEHQFELYLQPIYSLSGGRPVSAEALVRWNHPKKGLLSPVLFIPVFERNGFITKLDAYVWEQACQLLRDWMNRGIPILPISVNMSRINLYRPELCDQLLGLVQKYDLPPSLLKIEITESAYTDNPAQLLNVVNTLRESGFSVLMDDFGSGYSSLNMLKDITVDILKIDMKFLADFEHSKRAASILTAVVRMTKWLNMPVIAEGVETKAQVDYLRSIGCDKIQGFFFSPPLPIARFEGLMHDLPVPNAPALVPLPDLMDFNEIWNGNSVLNLIFNNLFCGAGIYELSGDCLEVLRVNNAYYKLLGRNPQVLYDKTLNIFEELTPDDHHRLYTACQAAISSRHTADTTTAVLRADGTRVPLSVRVNYLAGTPQNALLCLILEQCAHPATEEPAFFPIEHAPREAAENLA